MSSLDLSRPRRIHVVGVGGAGMSAYASVLAAMGHTVTGSDLKASPTLDRLEAAGVPVTVGHRPEQVEGAEVVAVSSAVDETNPEVQEARRRHLEVVSRAELLAAICAQRRTAAVSGTHGKTTTTSMLALILVEANLAPSFLIGGDVNEIGTNAVWDDGPWLVVEADESDGTMLQLAPQLAVVTNVDIDHLDHYGSFDALVDAFDQFCAAAGNEVVTGCDDATSAALGTRHGAALVGTSAQATHRITELETGPFGTRFALEEPGAAPVRFELAVPGAHNARNAAVAAVAARRVGASYEAARRALSRFAGVARRFEYRGEHGGIRFVDDYAHLPAEVAAALSTAAAVGAERVVAVFQPHRYSRTAQLAERFGDAFSSADAVVVTDVYPAGEQPLPGVTGRLVADAVARVDPQRRVDYVASRRDLLAHLRLLLRPGDLCVTLGAGDLTSLPDEFGGTGR